MQKLSWALGGLVALAAISTHAAAQTRPQLLVLGTMHFANPGLDKVNTKVEDVLTPSRQAEIETLVTRLAAFRPTHVAVEWPASQQAELDRRYAAWRAGKTDVRGEREQIGFRLAAALNLPRVDAVDWQGKPPGTDADYDFEAWAREHGQDGQLAAEFAKLQGDSTTLERRMPCLTISGWLRLTNSPEVQGRNARSYLGMARIGDAGGSKAADWVGTWYARNLKIWANLTRVASRPNDRVVMVFGSGHRPLIEQIVRQSNSFELNDPLLWLPKDRRMRDAADKPCDGSR